MLKTSIIIVILLIVSNFLLGFLEWYLSIGIQRPKGDYDFIIVGGGTSGSVVANRLSENNNVRVLLLEAGGEDPLNPSITIPLLVSDLQKGPLDWQYVTESQQFSSGALINNQCFWPRGKILGGSSILNYLAYARGSRHDYDAWESLGATGWNYEEVLPYFKKSENAIAEELKDSSVHGFDGYLKVDMNEPLEATKWFIEAGKDLGLDEIDYNADDEGFAVVQSTLEDGRRQSASKAFLYPFAERENLDIVTNAHVTRVLFETGNDHLPRAFGVEYVKNGMSFTVVAKKEVILSAGAIATPQLLMLSGVGPKNHLEEHEIKVVADLPGVGENLQDHTFVTVGFDYPSSETDGITISSSEAMSLKNIINYALFGEGPLASTGIDGFGFIKTNKDDPGKTFDYPDIYLLLLTLQQDLSQEGARERNTKLFNQKPEILEEIGSILSGEEGDAPVDFSIAVGLGHPKSIGTLRLASNNYKDYPLLDPKYFKDERDLDTYIKAMKFMEQIEQTPAFKSRGIKINIYSPQCEGNGESPRSEDFYKCYVRNSILTQYHHSATAKMGSPDDQLAVTNPRLKVYKVEGLRVADASVMPQVTSANTQAPCYMIGEKAADMIKEDWNLN